MLIPTMSWWFCWVMEHARAGYITRPIKSHPILAVFFGFCATWNPLKTGQMISPWTQEITLGNWPPVARCDSVNLFPVRIRMMIFLLQLKLRIFMHFSRKNMEKSWESCCADQRERERLIQKEAKCVGHCWTRSHIYGKHLEDMLVRAKNIRIW